MSEYNNKTKEEFVNQYLNEYSELEYWVDFYKAQKTKTIINITEYEKDHLDNKNEIYGPGKVPKGIINDRCDADRDKVILASNIFTIKLGAENIKKIFKKIFRENSERGAANEECPPDWISEKEYLEDEIRRLENELEEYFGITEVISDERRKKKEIEVKLEKMTKLNNQNEERIISLNNDLKIERE
ncbi:unnamed protein product [Rhizophagus irregularis]|uniref:Uncharacterized protein n=1 Tax=Rhizophagus irregularis TaxID=588596 RepID=A0A2I1HB17_9GLOM|nr:hypothetical protein RhiirA4_506359 [Rhizophagus irregularis]CAB4438106.1 unnamed protein product [Rhizophagus irregularis]